MTDIKQYATFLTQSELEHVNDRKLVEQVQNGDTEAFNPLVLKYQQKIYNLIYLRVRNQETAKDLCQDVFLKAFQALPHFKQNSAFYSWLYQIAVNCSIDFLRKQNRQRGLIFEELPFDADNTLQMTEAHPPPSETLENEEFRRIIRKAVRQLPPGQRRVFKLRYRKELPIKEIATRLNKSEGTIKSHLHHAHQRLRGLLLPYLQNEPLQWNGEN